MRFRLLPLIAALLGGALPILAAPESASISELKLTQLEQRRAKIDAELSQLAQTSLRSGVGSIGYRSDPHATSNHTEWVEIELEKEVAIDEIALVPTLWRDSKKGFQADAFPETFRALAITAKNPEGTVIAAYDSSDGILPRIAPLIIPASGITASRIRIEVSRLPLRAFDQKYVLQLSEVLIFSGEKNVALRRPVSCSSSVSPQRKESPWNQRFLVDGHTPYLMDAAIGKKSMAYINPTRALPSLTLDLGARHRISRIHLHTVDQSDTVPQAYAGNHGMPQHLKIEGANLPNFSDAVTLLQTESVNMSDIGPIMMWNIPETLCRFVRVAETNPPESFRIGFAEIELYSNNLNVARGKQASNVSTTPPFRSLDTLTDGRNLYGNILPIRTWLNQLTRRHDLETERPQVMQELAQRYESQKINLRRISWLAAILLLGIVTVVLIEKITRQRAISKTRERIAANLHDELGANLHAIGLLGDFAKKIVARKNDSGECAELTDVIDEVRSLTEETGETARYCTNMLETKEIHAHLVKEMKRTTSRLLADLEHEATFPDDSKLNHLKPRRRIDLYLFYKECLTNIIRHSGATRVSAQLTATTKEIKLIISDNGHGLTKNEAPKSLRRRARILGGTVTVDSLTTGGTQITLRFSPRRLFRFNRNK